MAKEAAPERFEKLYAKLDERVAKLEQGGLSLEESIALYEEGMTLARACQERLDEAELKITKLKEAFAPLPQRANGSALHDTPEVEYEYAPEDEPIGDVEDFR